MKTGAKLNPKGDWKRLSHERATPASPLRAARLRQLVSGSLVRLRQVHKYQASALGRYGNFAWRTPSEPTARRGKPNPSLDTGHTYNPGRKYPWATHSA